jgi:hypothetical protein
VPIENTQGKPKEGLKDEADLKVLKNQLFSIFEGRIDIDVLYPPMFSKETTKLLQEHFRRLALLERDWTAYFTLSALLNILGMFKLFMILLP